MLEPLSINVDAIAMGSGGGFPCTLLEHLQAAGVHVNHVSTPEKPLLLLWIACPIVDALAALKELNPSGASRQIMVTCDSQLLSDESATWRILDAGATDIVAAGRDDECAAQAIAARLRRWAAIDSLLATPTVSKRLVGRSPTWLSALRQVVEAASFSDSSVLLTGESGVGKEAAAALIHELDRRPKKGRLITLDCTTIVPELSGSEFFGHERGAFTGAETAREGAFALSHGGTLFLDEVGELPLGLQAQLLRAIQERTFKRVGANTWQRTEFRLVCATNRNLIDEVAAGRFRRDLYHRIAACSVRLPSLRERASDILLLARHFLSALLTPDEPAWIELAVCHFLLRREYPGNVRDLQQLVTRIGKRHVGPGPITIGSVPIDELRQCNLLASRPEAALDEAVSLALSLGMNLKDLGRAACEAAIRLALRDEDGNLQRAARRLGVTDRALQLRRARVNGEAPLRTVDVAGSSG